MVDLFKKHPVVLCLMLLGVFSLWKIVSINAGIISLEPDEANHIEVVRSLREGFVPRYFGIPFFYGPPLFMYLSLVVSFFTRDDFLSVRLVSLLMSFLTSVVIFYYLKEKLNARAGLAGGILYTLLPLIVFYSRVGLMETTLGFFSFLFFYLYEKATTRSNYALFLCSGLVLGLALLTKLTALVLFLIPGVCILLGLVGSIYNKEKFDFRILIGTSWTVLISLGLVLPLLAFYYFSEPVFFKEQVKYILSYGPKASSIGEILVGSEKFVRMYSWGALVLLPLGLTALLKDKKFLLFNLSFLGLLFILLRNPLSTETLRYYVFFTPFLTVVLALGFRKALTFGKYMTAIFVVALLTTLIPYSAKAFFGSSHSAIKDTASYLKEKASDKWIFYNYWPTTFVVYSANFKGTWLSGNSYDSNAFAGGVGSKFEKIEGSSLTHLKKEGGIVVLRSPFVFEEKFGRKALGEIISKKSVKLSEVTDETSFYPHLLSGERFSVYEVNPSDLKDVNEEDYVE